MDNFATLFHFFLFHCTLVSFMYFELKEAQFFKDSGTWYVGKASALRRLVTDDHFVREVKG